MSRCLRLVARSHTRNCCGGLRAVTTCASWMACVTTRPNQDECDSATPTASIHRVGSLGIMASLFRACMRCARPGSGRFLRLDCRIVGCNQHNVGYNQSLKAWPLDLNRAQSTGLTPGRSCVPWPPVIGPSRNRFVPSGWFRAARTFRTQSQELWNQVAIPTEPQDGFRPLQLRWRSTKCSFATPTLDRLRLPTDC